MNLKRLPSSDSLVGEHLNYYRQLLSSQKEIQLSSFIDKYLQMGSLIHSLASEDTLDLAALNYSVTRLPPLTFKLKRIVLSQNLDDFRNCGIFLDSKHQVSTRNRRRLMYLDIQHQTLYCLLNSSSDIDDIINLLLIYIIEYRKIKKLQLDEQKLSKEPLSDLKTIFSSDWQELLEFVKNFNFDPEIKLYPTTEEVYVQNCHSWWQQAMATSFYFNLNQTPVYFVSSNSHSLINIIGGFINSKQSFIFDHTAHNFPTIYEKWFQSKVEHNLCQINDFLYYLSEAFLKDNPQYINEKSDYEKKLGVIKLGQQSLFPADVQIIPLKSLSLSVNIDANLKIPDRQLFSESKALIVNIQYPLGIAAKYLLNEVINYFSNLKGVYIIGKAAILNGTIGDFMIPETVLDEVTNSIFKIKNVFNVFFPFKNYISQVFTNQKAVCVYGTLLENRNQIENYKKTNFNIVEMESSNFLSAIVENYILEKQPILPSSYYSLSNLPLDLGIINYASDNPLTQNLGHESIDFRGIETTYLSSLAVLQRIIDLETAVK